MAVGYEVYIAIGGISLSVIGYAVRLTWQTRNIEKEISEDFNAHIENLERDIARLEREAMARADTRRHETGEMGAALRQKIYEVEMFSRDTFVKQDAFDQAISRLERSIDKGVDKLEEKLDDAITRLRNGK